MACPATARCGMVAVRRCGVVPPGPDIVAGPTHTPPTRRRRSDDRCAPAPCRSNMHRAADRTHRPPPHGPAPRRLRCRRTRPSRRAPRPVRISTVRRAPRYARRPSDVGRTSRGGRRSMRRTAADPWNSGAHDRHIRDCGAHGRRSLPDRPPTRGPSAFRHHRIRTRRGRRRIGPIRRGEAGGRRAREPDSNRVLCRGHFGCRIHRIVNSTLDELQVVP